MNVLAVGAHPDDFEVGCYGTLAQHNIAGDNLFGLTLCLGEHGGDPEVRKSESLKSADIINMKLEFGHFKDGMIPYDITTISFIENFIKKHNIDIVYSTSINERHQDHKNIGLSVLVAGRNIPKEVYQFETISTTNDFDPRMFKDISDVIEIKKQCIDQHKSQEHRTYIENYDVVNKWRSLKLGYPERYYESFEIIKLVK